MLTRPTPGARPLRRAALGRRIFPHRAGSISRPFSARRNAMPTLPADPPQISAEPAEDKALQQ